MTFLWAFLIGGVICALGQLLILKTNWTPARILVTFVVLGAIMQVCMVFEPLKELAGAGVTTPITGFGAGLVKGTFENIDKYGFLGIFTGGLTAMSAGIAVAIVSGLVIGMIFKSRSK